MEPSRESDKGSNLELHWVDFALSAMLISFRFVREQERLWANVHAIEVLEDIAFGWCVRVSITR